MRAVETTAVETIVSIPDARSLRVFSLSLFPFAKRSEEISAGIADERTHRTFAYIREPRLIILSRV